MVEKSTKRLPYPEPIELEGKYAKAQVSTPNSADTFDTDAAIKWMEDHAEECDKVLDDFIQDQKLHFMQQQD